MKLSRSSRLVAALLVLFSILFMQLAVAAYTCPAESVDRIELATTANVDMADCHDMDPVQPSLCHAHGHSGEQSLDKPPIPAPQPFIAVGFGLPASPLAVTKRPAFNLPETSWLTHATSPPVAIRNCCFRI